MQQNKHKIPQLHIQHLGPQCHLLNFRLLWKPSPCSSASHRVSLPVCPTLACSLSWQTSHGPSSSNNLGSQLQLALAAVYKRPLSAPPLGPSACHSALASSVLYDPLSIATLMPSKPAQRRCCCQDLLPACDGAWPLDHSCILFYVLRNSLVGSCI